MIMRFAFVLLVCVGLCGCESARQSVREKFTGPAYERRVVAGESRAVFDAARSTVSAMGFRITREGAAQGVIEGLAGIESDDRLRGSSQRAIKVRLEPTVSGGTEVAVLFTEIVEDSFGAGAAGATETALRGQALYAAFFERLAEALARR